MTDNIVLCTESLNLKNKIKYVDEPLGLVVKETFKKICFSLFEDMVKLSADVTCSSD